MDRSDVANNGRPSAYWYMDRHTCEHDVTWHIIMGHCQTASANEKQCVALQMLSKKTNITHKSAEDTTCIWAVSPIYNKLSKHTWGQVLAWGLYKGKTRLWGVSCHLTTEGNVSSRSLYRKREMRKICRENKYSTSQNTPNRPSCCTRSWTLSLINWRRSSVDVNILLGHAYHRRCQ